MELKQIKELMTVMERTGTKRLTIKKEGFELQLEREDRTRTYDSSVNFLEETHLKNEIAQQRANVMLSRGGEIPSSLGNPIISPKVEGHVNAVCVLSPMVGTFYTAPSTDEPNFVKVGDKIEKDTVVCIIEAMKVMNEVKAGMVGIVAEILVENGHPVEFATKLFRVS